MRQPPAFDSISCAAPDYRAIRVRAAGWNNLPGRWIDEEQEVAMVREGPPEPVPETAPYPAEKARGGKVILSRPWQRLLFIAGLIAACGIVIALFIYGTR
jgi:hypothetical protein